MDLERMFPLVGESRTRGHSLKNRIELKQFLPHQSILRLKKHHPQRVVVISTFIIYTWVRWTLDKQGHERILWVKWNVKVRLPSEQPWFYYLGEKTHGAKLSIPGSNSYVPKPVCHGLRPLYHFPYIFIFRQFCLQ